MLKFFRIYCLTIKLKILVLSYSTLTDNIVNLEQLGPGGSYENGGKTLCYTVKTVDDLIDWRLL